MLRVLIAAALAVFCLAGCAMVDAAHTWNPLVAAGDAERDIASGHIRFCFVGGRAPRAPGVPDGSYQVVRRYPRVAVGPQGCIQDQGSDIRFEYARRYNVRMWHHVSRMQRQSSNQSMKPTAGSFAINF